MTTSGSDTEIDVANLPEAAFESIGYDRLPVPPKAETTAFEPASTPDKPHLVPRHRLAPEDSEVPDWQLDQHTRKVGKIGTGSAIEVIRNANPLQPNAKVISTTSSPARKPSPRDHLRSVGFTEWDRTA